MPSTRSCGIGIILRDGLCGVDLDHAINNGEVMRWAHLLVTQLDSFTDLSPSGTGMKVLLWGDMQKLRELPEVAAIKDQRLPCRADYCGGGVEVYDQSSPHFFTITGHAVGDYSRTVQERQEALELLYLDVFGERLQEIAERLGRAQEGSQRAQPVPEDEVVIDLASHAANGEKFVRLYEKGDISGYDDDASRADLALVGMIAFWTGPDAERIERIFGASALGQRDKWARADYRRMTIEKGMVLSDYFDWTRYHEEQRFRRDSQKVAEMDFQWEPAAEQEVKSLYLEDLRRRGIPAVPLKRRHTFGVKKCPCCGIPGVFSIKDGRGTYHCGGPPRSWADARTLWKDNQMNIHFYTVADVLQSPDPDWLILDHLPRRGVCLTYGPPGIAKSFFVLGKALSVGYGVPFLGCETTMGRVVYLYSEGGVAIKRRIKAWLLHHDITSDDERLRNVGFHFRRYDLSLNQHIENLTDNIQAWGKPDLVVIDTLSKNFKASENEDMGKMVSAAYDLVETLDCTVDIVHHTGKDVSRGPRGGSQLDAGVDLSWELEGVRNPAQDNEFIGVKVSPRKVKDGRKRAPFYLDFREYQFSPRPHDHSIVLVPSAKSEDEHKKEESQATEAEEEALYHDFLSIIPPREERKSKEQIKALARLNGMGKRVFARLWDRAFAAGELVATDKSRMDRTQLWHRKPVD
jgi:hypothetical protein